MSSALSSTLRSFLPSLNALDVAFSNRTFSPRHPLPPLSHTSHPSILPLDFVSPSSSTTSHSPRRNEHLAVLLPKHLWKVRVPQTHSLCIPPDVSCLSSRIRRPATVTSSTAASPSPFLTADMSVASFPALTPSSDFDLPSALQKVWWCLLR